MSSTSVLDDVDEIGIITVHKASWCDFRLLGKFETYDVTLPFNANL